MIYEVLNFLRINLDNYIADGRSGVEPVMVLSNPWTSNDSSKNFSFLNSVSLINIEEERIFKTQLPQLLPQGKENFIQRPPDLKLNLYVLFSAYNKNYEDALKLISMVVSYFQMNTVFQKDKLLKDMTPLPDGVDKLVIELYSPSFEQQNQIWASLSIGYLPSVIYKIRMITIDEDPKKAKMIIPSIQKINVDLTELEKGSATSEITKTINQ